MKPSAELGTYITTRDAELLRRIGLKRLVQQRRRRGDIAPIKFTHNAAYLLKQYKTRGVPVKVRTPHWSPAKIHQALARGPHRSCLEHTDLLEEEFVDMVLKGQWIVLPYKDVNSFLDCAFPLPVSFLSKDAGQDGSSTTPIMEWMARPSP